MTTCREAGITWLFRVISWKSPFCFTKYNHPRVVSQITLTITSLNCALQGDMDKNFKTTLEEWWKMMFYCDFNPNKTGLFKVLCRMGEGQIVLPPPPPPPPKYFLIHKFNNNDTWQVCKPIKFKHFNWKTFMLMSAFSQWSYF